MSVTKIKPTRTPHVMDEWTVKRVSACDESMRVAQEAIAKSKKLVEQSKEIKARVESRLKTGRDKRGTKAG